MLLYSVILLINLFYSGFIFSLDQSIKFKDFDPKNKDQYAQVLKLVQDNKDYLLDPGEDPDTVVYDYSQAVLGNPKKNYNDLQIKILYDTDQNQVVGFISYYLQKQDKTLPAIIRTIAIDPKYRKQGHGKFLISEIEQEARKISKKDILTVVYSCNDSMLHLLKKRNYSLYAQDCCNFIKDPETGKMNLAATLTLYKSLQN